MLNELYLGFRKSRRGAVEIPKIRFNNIKLDKGQLLSSPFEIEGSRLTYELELPFDVKSNDKIFFCFCDQPFAADAECDYLNRNHDVFSIDTRGKIHRKCHLDLEIKQNGFVKPTFLLMEKGIGTKREPIRIECQEFYFDNLRVKEGYPYIGIDFGTSNSYLARFLSIPREIQASAYPEFIVDQSVMEMLRDLEIEVQNLQEVGVLSKDSILSHAQDRTLLMVFHSNKIEGNPLTQGETDAVLKKSDAIWLSKNQREAYNVQSAYLWLLDNYNEYYESPETFIRQLNKIILDGVSTGGGQYRNTPVKIAGMEFTPPHQSAVPAFMEELGKEIKRGVNGRSVLEFAASIHTKLVYIHPFVDANGRTARLLMNAILLANNLPVIIVNFADKQRYLEALSQSNEGDLSALVMYFVECIREQFEELKSRDADKEEITDEVLAEIVTEKAVDDPVEKALDEMGLKPDEDPLTSVMALTIQKMKEENYDAWRQAYGSLLSDMKVLVGKYNEQYKTAGFRMTLREYDMLSYEKYVDIYGGKKVSRTWYFSVEIINPMNTRVRFLLFFERITQALEIKFKNVNKVCLTMARFDGVTYPRLTSEPITLRKIVYLDGALVFIGREDEMIEKSGIRNISYLLRKNLAEFIKTYLLT